MGEGVHIWQSSKNCSHLIHWRMLEFLWSNSLVATSVIRFCDVLCHIGKILQLPKLSLLHTVRRNICVKRWVTERGQPAGNTHTNTQIYTITEPLCQGKAETGNIGVTRNIKAPCHCVTVTAPSPRPFTFLSLLQVRGTLVLHVTVETLLMWHPPLACMLMEFP